MGHVPASRSIQWMKAIVHRSLATPKAVLKRRILFVDPMMSPTATNAYSKKSLVSKNYILKSKLKVNVTSKRKKLRKKLPRTNARLVVRDILCPSVALMGKLSAMNVLSKWPIVLTSPSLRLAWDRVTMTNINRPVNEVLHY